MESTQDKMIIKLLDELEKANKEIERLREDRNYYQLRATRLSGEHAAMKEALEWYADEGNHRNIADYPSSEVYSDFGKLAQNVLSTLSQPKDDTP